MDTTNIIAVIILAATGLLIFFGTRGRLFTKPVPKAKSGPSVITTAGTSGGAAATAATPPTTTPPAPPAPAPAATARSYGWVWWLIIIIAVVFIGRWIWYEGRSVRSIYSPPQATAPKRELQKQVIPCRLQFVGGDGVIERNGVIEVQKKGQVFFSTETLTWRKDAIFHIKVCLRRETTGQVKLTINGGRGGEKFYLVPGSEKFLEPIFFETEEIGRPEYFNLGTNQITLSPIEGSMQIQYVIIEMIYWE